MKYTYTLKMTGNYNSPVNMAVSYTHLDVYKRQPLNVWNGAFWGM